MLLRGLMNIYTNQRAARQYGDRVFRESSVLRATYEVWSDVASELGLGFRSGDSGPLVHGELSSGAALEVLVLENDEGHYHTLARARKSGARSGALTLRPHDPWTRVRSYLIRTTDLDPTFTARFDVRASSDAVAKSVLSETVRDLVGRLEARRPELDVDADEATLVLEGVELEHDNLYAVIAMLDELMGATPAPYRSAAR